MLLRLFSFFLQLLAELQKQRNLSGEPFVARLRCMGHLVNRFGLPADLFHGVADREQVDEECEDGEKAACDQRRGDELTRNGRKPDNQRREQQQDGNARSRCEKQQRGYETAAGRFILHCCVVPGGSFFVAFAAGFLDLPLDFAEFVFHLVDLVVDRILDFLSVPAPIALQHQQAAA